MCRITKRAEVCVDCSHTISIITEAMDSCAKARREGGFGRCYAVQEQQYNRMMLCRNCEYIRQFEEEMRRGRSRQPR